MKIDKIISALFPSSNDKLHPKNLRDYIREDFIQNKNSKRVYVILPGWYQSPTWLYKILKNRIFSRGYSYVYYSFKPEILSTNLNLTKNGFSEISKKVALEIKSLKRKFSEVVLIGISLGAVSASMIANKSPELDKLVLVCPGNSLAESLWYGTRTRDIEEDFVKRKISLKNLKKIWKNLAPENNLNNLHNKEILIYISQSDIVVPYKNGKKLIYEMKKKKLKPIVKENKYLGHYLTIVKFCLFDREIFK